MLDLYTPTVETNNPPATCPPQKKTKPAFIVYAIWQDSYLFYPSAIGRIWHKFTNGLGDRGSIPGQVIPKTQKWYLMPPCLTLSIIRYRLRVKSSNPGKGVAPSSIPWCRSYRKESLRVTLDYGRQLYFFYYFGLNSEFFFS